MINKNFNLNQRKYYPRNEMLKPAIINYKTAMFNLNIVKFNSKLSKNFIQCLILHYFDPNTKYIYKLINLQLYNNLKMKYS